MTTYTLLGGMFGAGFVCIVLGLRRRTLGLKDTVARFELQAPFLETDGQRRQDSPRKGRLSSIGEALGRLAARFGRPLVRLEDLTLLERDTDAQLATIGMAAICLGAVGALGAGALGAVTVRAPEIGVAVGGLGGTALGMFLPGLDLKRAATRERDHFLRALSCWLELVALGQAGGMGVESALQAGCAISEDHSFALLRAALEQSRLAATTPWHALARLGREIDVPELAELGSTLALAGTEGARVRASLVAKSASLRQRQLSKAQAEANSTTERLFLPSVVLMFAFMVFLMYPAAVRLAHVL
ncbi:MAG: secretion system protein [Acidimicrobiales bacterium]